MKRRKSSQRRGKKAERKSKEKQESRKGFENRCEGIRQREKGRASRGGSTAALVSYVTLGLFPNKQTKTDNHEHLPLPP